MIPSDMHDMQVDKETILNILYQSDVRLTPQALIREIKSRVLVTSSAAKKIVRQLIDEQELSYHYLYGSTYVEKSFLKPVRITRHFVLTPPGFDTQSTPTDIDITIEPGISFGAGQHPTTQLCLAAIEFCFFEQQLIHLKPGLVGADIGTGSGVLAMAMCLSGLAACNAYEIDPVSINEAKKNIALNHLTKQINVVEDTMKECNSQVSIICANLRFPTLKTLSDMIWDSLTDHGIAILSGVREWETQALIACYSAKGFELAWQKHDKQWSGFVWIKKR
ncbi:50S ribosomal protein L11 methyltransferase [Desulfobacula phenolica]|nr:50S ribosomal protein L11 methyltransferase [Desulfobacula phenolica]